MPRARTVWRIVFATTAVLVAVPIGLSAYGLYAMRKGFEAHAARGREALAAHRQEFMDDQNHGQVSEGDKESGNQIPGQGLCHYSPRSAS